MTELDPARPPAAILAETPGGVRNLVVACQTLFAGDWDDLAEDLRRRQAGRPYLFRLDLGLAEDPLLWVHRLKAYETARGEPIALEEERP